MFVLHSEHSEYHRHKMNIASFTAVSFSVMVSRIQTKTKVKDRVFPPLETLEQRQKLKLLRISPQRPNPPTDRSQEWPVKTEDLLFTSTPPPTHVFHIQFLFLFIRDFKNTTDNKEGVLF